MIDNEIVQVNAEEESSIMLSNMENRVQLIKYAISIIPQVCHERNILDMGGNPYIDSDGCQKIAVAAGISFSRPQVESEWVDDPDTGARVYEVIVEGEANLGNKSIFEVGGCNSQDKFLSSRKLPTLQLKLEVKKKALANWQGRCVRTLLGLKELTWKELENAGFRQGKAPSIDYNKGAQSGKSADADDTRDKIRDAVLAAVDGNATAAKELLEVMTSFIGKDGTQVRGKANVKDLSDKAANFLWAKIKKNDDDWQRACVEIRQQYAVGDQQ